MLWSWLLLAGLLWKLTAGADIERAVELVQSESAEGAGLEEAIGLLEASDSAHALKALGLFYYFGNNAMEPKYTHAFRTFERAFGLDRADGEILFMLGLMYSYGMGCELDLAKGILYYYFGAKLKDVRSLAAIGYHTFYGVGVNQSCSVSKSYYLRAAQIAARTMSASDALYAKRPVRLSSSSLPSKEASVHAESLEYYEYSADAEDVASLTLLGQLHYLGTREYAPDHQRARKYLEKAAAAGGAAAASILGQIYYRGEGVPIDYAKAHELFLQGVQGNVAVAHNGLGNMYWHGRGVAQDLNAAEKYFSSGASLEHPESQYNLALLLIGQKNPVYTDKAFNYLVSATQSGFVLANVELAKRFFKSEGTCGASIVLLRQVLDKGAAKDGFKKALSEYRANRPQQALSHYIYLAAQGFEMAHYNAAVVLEQMRDSALLSRALLHYHRSAKLGYIPSNVKVAEFFFHGYGLSRPDKAASVAYYIVASSAKPRNAEALFCLAWAFENGVGMDKDLWSARDFYESVLRYEPKAWIAVHISLAKVGAKLWIQGLLRRFASKSVQKQIEEPNRMFSLCLALCIAVFLIYFVQGRRQLPPVPRRPAPRRRPVQTASPNAESGMPKPASPVQADLLERSKAADETRADAAPLAAGGSEEEEAFPFIRNENGAS